LNVFEIRKLLADQDYIVFNKEIKYNDEKRDEDSAEYKEYLAKDLFYFITRENSCYDCEEKSRWIHITPSGYDIKKKDILNIEYRIKKWGNSEWLRNEQKNISKNKRLFLPPSKIIKTP
jgi:hypothetical protein